MATVTNIPLGLFDITNVTNLADCFQQCNQWSEDIAHKRRMRERRLKLDKIYENGIFRQNDNRY